jgi:DNA-binding MarR family transcriptional regulator/GNAT superfamily N-acetyltransferase
VAERVLPPAPRRPRSSDYSQGIEADLIADVRRFNRTVTERVGALHDRYLARDRSLGESRLLWEIGAGGTDGCEVRAVRDALGLDSGYLSRMLRSLESAGLVEVGPSTGDRRVRTARLTLAGRAERRLLDDRSEALAASMLAPLDRARQQRLVAAMGEVTRLLTASLVEISELDPGHRRARRCLQRYFTELDDRFAAGFDPERSISAGLEELRRPAGAFLVAMLHGEPVGCGALKFHGRRPTELKRMWVDPAARGLGVGRRLLAALEATTRASGSRVVHLETNRSLVEAIALYRSSGYREVSPFNDEPYADHWFEKRLP